MDFIVCVTHPPLALLSSLNGVTDIPFMIIGFTGLISLVTQHWTSQTLIITLIFVVLIGVAAVATVVFPLTGDISMTNSSALGLLVIFALVPLYADWMLGSMVDNLVGVPSGDVAVIYWLYFASKRLNMLNL